MGKKQTHDEVEARAEDVELRADVKVLLLLRRARAVYGAVDGDDHHHDGEDEADVQLEGERPVVRMVGVIGSAPVAELGVGGIFFFVS